MSAAVERTVGALLLESRATVAVAESCTGGLLGGRITSVPGSSRYFLGGIISYANEAKVRCLGVDRRMLKGQGAVSETVARRMASAVRRRFRADFGVAVTGIAGPAGGTREKPVGLVYVAVAGRRGCEVRRHVFAGSRRAVRQRSVAAALRLLSEILMAPVRPRRS